MDELGIIINQNGESMSFGKWKPRELRKEENPDDWHTDSFMKTIYPTEWFQSLGIPYKKKKELQTQLDLFARYGLIIIANSKEESNQVGENRIIMTVPDTITDEQIQTLMNRKESFIEFENGHVSFIDVFDATKEYAILESFYSIKDYYDYLDKLLESRHSQIK